MHLSVPLPTRNEQVEQDRAPDVLPHHRELAWSTVGEPRGGGQPDWLHDDEDGVCDSVGIGREQLSNRSRGHGSAAGEPRYQAGQVPRRMELYHPAKDLNGQFILARGLNGGSSPRTHGVILSSHEEWVKALGGYKGNVSRSLQMLETRGW